MSLLNLSLAQLLTLFGAACLVLAALYLLDRARRRQTVATLRFWFSAEQLPITRHRRRVHQPLSLILQILSVGLLLVAIAQPRFGGAGSIPRDHVLVLETSAWMAARTGVAPNSRSLMDEARARARAYIKALPPADRVMLVRADALATPATGFESNRKKLEDAIAQSRPRSTALNLDQALEFARQAQSLSARRRGEIVFAGAGRIPERGNVLASSTPLPNLRVLQVPDSIENCGLRKIGLRKSASQSDLWEIYISARNYGQAPKNVTIAMQFGGAAAGSRRLMLPAGGEREATFEYRTRAAGLLEARLFPTDAFPDDNRAVIELPQQKQLNVLVYSDEPDLLRPILAANPRVNATFRPTRSYAEGLTADLVILDRFHPPASVPVDSIWIDPPAEGSPIAVRAVPTNTKIERWQGEHSLGLGLRAQDLRLERCKVFEAAPEDVKVAEVAAGPVIIARPGKPKVLVLGFHPMYSAMRYQLTTPLLFANILRWMAPEIFRRWELSGGSVGLVNLAIDADVQPSEIKVSKEGLAVPFSFRNHSLEFFAGTPGIVRVSAGERDYVYSLTLPELAENRWEPPVYAKRGIPVLKMGSSGSTDLWQVLALLGALGMLVEWRLYGEARRYLLWRAQPARRSARLARKAS